MRRTRTATIEAKDAAIRIVMSLKERRFTEITIPDVVNLVFDALIVSRFVTGSRR